MKDELDQWADQLQESIYEDAKADYSPQVYERWRRPRLMGRIDDADASGSVTGSCGDSMEIYFKVQNGLVVQSLFYTNGCGPSIAAGSMAAEIALDKKLEQVADVSGPEILNALGGLPEESKHCATLAAAALNAAVDNFFYKSASGD